MFAIVAAVLFAIALLIELVKWATTIGVVALVIAGLLALSLHHGGFSSRIQSQGGGLRSRKWGRRRL
ncbi:MULTISPECIES: hypothetical protein [unclassified Nocardia]|uniref:hypothetical protein n=1 Tax=unclassified Nocardia TaxID=2637762 RepID=UPI002E1222AB|nr:hypothetical protein OG326_36365 [Nocardia sp. NBC_01327]